MRFKHLALPSLVLLLRPAAPAGDDKGGKGHGGPAAACRRPR